MKQQFEEKGLIDYWIVQRVSAFVSEAWVLVSVLLLNNSVALKVLAPSVSSQGLICNLKRLEYFLIFVGAQTSENLMKFLNAYVTILCIISGDLSIPSLRIPEW